MSKLRFSAAGVYVGALLVWLAAAATLATANAPAEKEFVQAAEQAVDPGQYDHPVRVACVGDSITVGVGTTDPKTQGYPAQLQHLLGPRWEVTTFAAGGRTLLRKQDPLDYRRALKYRPDVVIIALGTNDARQATWDKHGAEFVADYVGVIKDFQRLDSHPKIWVCLPPPAFPEHWGITETLLSGTVIPAIQKAATEAGVPTIDLHTPLKDKKAWFPDFIHPNPDGAKRIAEVMAAAIARPTPGAR